MYTLRTFMEQNNYDGMPSFFHVLPEQTQVFLNNNEILSILKQNKGKTSNHFKHEIYSKFFQMEPRKKLTGFEVIEDLECAYRNKLIEKYGETKVDQIEA